MDRPIHRVIDLIDDSEQLIQNIPVAEARARLRGDPHDVLGIEGSFALTARDGELVLMARSLDRPMRYFLAKEVSGPLLVVAERIDEIADQLRQLGYGEQFHPSYTRMVPAHHVTALRLIGCPDPNPQQRRFFTPPRATLAPDLDQIGDAYVEALTVEVASWLDSQDPGAPLGVLFSGGIDSTAVLVTLYHALLDRGESATRLKAFTLAVDGEGADLKQARRALDHLAVGFLHEAVEVSSEALDPLEAVAVIEDYKPLDVECATMVLALLTGIRARYPEWRLIVDGDGGDENLKDYPLEEDAELTIRSVVSNSMLYQEGWGVDAIKHSMTYSGGLSRACVRGRAPARHLGFVGFSPFTRPAVVRVAEAIPFDRLTAGSTERLYALKGEIVRRGLERRYGRTMPIYPKRRFQHGAATPSTFAARFSVPEDRYRAHFQTLWGDPAGGRAL